VQTTTTMIVPISLIRPDAFHAEEGRDELLQGRVLSASLRDLV